jgi:hypothetical protein
MPQRPEKENIMRKMLLMLSGVAVALTAAPAVAKEPKVYTCTKWENGVCVSTHRVRGDPPYKVGYVFDKTYTYTPISDVPQPVVTYYKLGPDERYVYVNGYVYVIDPATGAVTRVIDTLSH